MEDRRDAPDRTDSARERMRLRTEKLRQRADVARERVQAGRERHASVDIVFDLADHDSEVGGGIMAGALAYRLFIFMLPLALVAVAGLGIAASAASTTPEGAAKSLGLAGLVSNSVATAGRSPARWYALLFGIPILVFAARSVLRTLIVAHRLIWNDPRGAVTKPTVKATLQLLAALLAYFIVAAAAIAVRRSSSVGAVLSSVIIPLPFVALWLGVTSRLPHREAPWQALLPGAVLSGVGIAAFDLVVDFYIAPQADSKHDTYGTLGVAASLLVGLYLLSRLLIVSAMLNVTLFERGSRT